MSATPTTNANKTIASTVGAAAVVLLFAILRDAAGYEADIATQTAATSVVVGLLTYFVPNKPKATA